MKSAFLFAVLTLLIAQTKAATTTFDGNWWVTVDYHEYKNPDGSTALAAVKHFPVKVINGVLHGETGTRGAADWYELNGTMPQMAPLRYAPTVSLGTQTPQVIRTLVYHLNI